MTFLFGIISNRDFRRHLRRFRSSGWCCIGVEKNVPVCIDEVQCRGQMWRLSVVAVVPARTGYMEVKRESCGETSSTDANCVVCVTEKRGRTRRVRRRGV